LFADRAIGRGNYRRSSQLTQEFAYDDKLHVAAELSSSGAVTSVFVYGTKPNVPDYMYRGGVAYRIISDWIGSVRLVVNTTTGAIVQQLDYDEFGNVLSTSSDTSCPKTAQCFPFQPFGFARGLQDRDTGLVQFVARDYDPQVGRWTSKDPIRFAGGQTNLYVYAGDDPINGRDPTGLWSICDLFPGFCYLLAPLPPNCPPNSICPGSPEPGLGPGGGGGGRWSGRRSGRR
jgi:RHS repeat-associated protein